MKKFSKEHETTIAIFASTVAIIASLIATGTATLLALKKTTFIDRELFKIVKINKDLKSWGY